MVDTNADNSSLQEAFTQQQQKRSDAILEAAQRLVNMYRHADSFGDDFHKKLDDMLLAAGSDVQAALSDLQGGAVVRKYCEFLKEKAAPEDKPQEIQEPESIPQTGYLPSPDEDLPMPDLGTLPSAGMTPTQFESILKNFMATHQAELTALLSSQAETLSTLMQRLDQNASETATHQTDRLINALKQESRKQKHYSDVIEAPSQTPVLVPDDMEGF